MTEFLDLAHGYRVDGICGFEGQSDELIQFLDESVYVIDFGDNTCFRLDLDG